jgi:hypothetical protein
MQLADELAQPGSTPGSSATYVERPAVQGLFRSISSRRNGAVICPAFMRGL